MDTLALVYELRYVLAAIAGICVAVFAFTFVSDRRNS